MIFVNGKIGSDASRRSSTHSNYSSDPNVKGIQTWSDLEIVRNDMPVWHDNLVSVKDKEILSLGHLVPLTVLKLRFNQNPTVKVV